MAETTISPQTGPRSFLRRANTITQFSYFASYQSGLDLSALPPLEALKQVLLKPPKERTAKLIQYLQQSTKDLRFFTKLGEEVHYLCCQCMSYQSFPGDQFLFHQGDPGSQFYIVLNGKCSVMLPARVEDGLMEVIEYTAGDAFGDLAIVKRQPRSASVYCRTECHFAVLQKDDYLRIFGRLEENKSARKIEFLQKMAMFRHWTKGALAKLSSCFTERVYTRKQVVYSASDPATEIYFITHGEFQLMQPLRLPGPPNSLRQQGSLSMLAEVSVLSVEQFFGEEDVLDGRVRGFTCVCKSEKGSLLVLTKDVSGN